ncbi:MAG: protease inhibitor I42 family protein [Bacteroidetes bacterium]|nr:protease inhibitor I42 family protein [Bacteroidota bacterium]
MVTTTTEILKLKTGARQVFRMAGLVLAGFEWTYENSNEAVAGVEKSFEPVPADTVRQHVGQSATEVFTVTALKAGEATLRFRQVRQWEPNKPPRDEKSVKLIVD